MKIKRLSTKQIKERINFMKIIGTINFIMGFVALGTSIYAQNYLFGLFSLYLIINGMWLIEDIDFQKIILEIRHQGGKKQWN